MRKLWISSRSVVITFLTLMWFVAELWFIPPSFADTIVNCQNSTQPNCGNNTIQVDTAGMTGYVGGLVGDIAAISSLGSVTGLSGAGITSGLAALGSLVGGGMVAGVAITVAAPALVAIGTSMAVNHFLNSNNQQEQPQAN